MDRAETKENLKMKQILFILLFSIVPLSWAEDSKVLKIICDVNKEKYSLDVMRIYFDKNLLVQTSSRVDFWRTFEWGLKVTDDAYIATGSNDSVMFALKKDTLEMFDSVYEEPYENCREIKYKLWDDR